MARSAIEWTESTWNPVTGCTKLGSSRKGVTSDDLAERGDCPLGRCAGGGRRVCPVPDEPRVRRSSRPMRNRRRRQRRST